MTVTGCILVGFVASLLGDLEGLGAAIVISLGSVENFLVTTMRDGSTFDSHIKFSLARVWHHRLDDTFISLG